MAAKLASVSQFWQDFKLVELQKELDITATELAQRQDASEVSRKKLVEQSREFKKNTPEEARKLVAPLLKSFQLEIDALSKRSKSAEAGFLAIYKRLIDVPDPVPAFEIALGYQKKAQRVGDLEIETKQLRDTLEEYNSEFKEVRNQEVTVKNLKEKLREYEEKMDSTAASLASEKEAELAREFALKEKRVLDEKMELARRLGEAEQRAVTLQQALDQNQSELFELKSRYDEATSARSDELEMVMAEQERTAERAATAERELEQLRLERATNSDHAAVLQAEAELQRSAAMALRCAQLETELSAKEREVSQLVEEVQRLQSNIARQRDSGSNRVAALEEELTRRSELITEQQQTLKSMSDYEELKHELSVLKSLEFSSEGTAPVSPGVDTPKSLETLLLEKNKQLQDENTRLRNAAADSQGSQSALERQYTEAVQTLQQQKQLIAQLEEDLRSVNAVSAMFRGDAEGEAVPSTEAELVARAVQQNEVPITPVNSELQAAADSLLPIVQSQRERYRLRVQELEGQAIAQQQQLTHANAETDKLRSDNVKLYEKIRYLQSYGSKPVSQDAAESRYSRDYEAGLDPFANFTKKERQRKYGDLKPYDKITLSMGRFVMSNQIARAFCFFYTIILHCLVFLVLYKFAYDESSKRDLASECHQKFAEHMMQVHGGHKH